MVNDNPTTARDEPLSAAAMPQVDHPIAQPPSHPITQPPSHPITQSPSHPITQSPSHPITQSSAPREIRVTVQRTPDAERDKRLLGWVVDQLRAKPGQDRFCIIVRKNGAAVQLDFPNDTTTITPALEQQLVRRLGVGSVEVREGGEQ